MPTTNTRTSTTPEQRVIAAAEAWLDATDHHESDGALDDLALAVEHLREHRTTTTDHARHDMLLAWNHAAAPHASRR